MLCLEVILLLAFVPFSMAQTCAFTNQAACSALLTSPTPPPTPCADDNACTQQLTGNPTTTCADLANQCGNHPSIPGCCPISCNACPSSAQLAAVGSQCGVLCELYFGLNGPNWVFPCADDNACAQQLSGNPTATCADLASQCGNHPELPGCCPVSCNACPVPWGMGSDICSPWGGITCSGGLIVSLNLPNTVSLAGTLSTSVSKLSFLQSLTFSGAVDNLEIGGCNVGVADANSDRSSVHWSLLLVPAM